MFGYGKTAQAAVAAVSYLAEHYGEAGFKVGSAEVAAARKMSRALASKLLTTLSQKGLVMGRPGPNGGYTLARDPGEISQRDVVEVFERVEETPQCPFGPDWCGKEEPCPLHEAIVEQNHRYQIFLEANNFAQFLVKK